MQYITNIHVCVYEQNKTMLWNNLMLQVVENQGQLRTFF
jgi:hypothetical protein